MTAGECRFLVIDTRKDESSPFCHPRKSLAGIHLKNSGMDARWQPSGMTGIDGFAITNVVNDDAEDEFPIQNVEKDHSKSFSLRTNNGTL